MSAMWGLYVNKSFLGTLNLILLLKNRVVASRNVADLSTKEKEAQQDAWFPCPSEHGDGTARFGPPARQKEAEIDRLGRYASKEFPPGERRIPVAGIQDGENAVFSS